MITFQFSSIVAGPTNTFALAALLQIIAGVWMALRAMGLTGVMGRRGLASQYISAMGHSLQMIGTHAWRVTTQMIDLRPFGDRANPMLIGQSMSEMLTTIGSQSAIRERTVKATHPQPTSIGLRINAGQKSTKRAIIHASSIPVVGGPSNVKN